MTVLLVSGLFVACFGDGGESDKTIAYTSTDALAQAIEDLGLGCADPRREVKRPDFEQASCVLESGSGAVLLVQTDGSPLTPGPRFDGVLAGAWGVFTHDHKAAIEIQTQLGGEVIDESDF